MSGKAKVDIGEAQDAALEVLRHNARGPYHGLPRTAGWGYPEPYTRDLLIAGLGVLATGDEKLLADLRRVLVTLGKNQSPRGHIPSLVHDPDDRGASDTTPLFLVMVALLRKAMGDAGFLEEAVERALNWMFHQSPDDRVMVGQLPTSDWRDEQWVLGYGLYVNTLVYMYLRLLGLDAEAKQLRSVVNRFAVTAETKHHHVHEGLVLLRKPYYAMWSYKVLGNERFDLLGNSLAILSGMASPSRSRSIVAWVERECREMRANEDLAIGLPPNCFPFTRPQDPDWHPRHARFNQPGEYHNGGVWPFVSGFYVAALVAAGRHRLAERRLVDLARLNRMSRVADVRYGFNEWHRAQDGLPCGQDWQTWSAAMFLFAAKSVSLGRTPFFDTLQQPAERD